MNYLVYKMPSTPYTGGAGNRIFSFILLLMKEWNSKLIICILDWLTDSSLHHWTTPYSNWWAQWNGSFSSRNDNDHVWFKNYGCTMSVTPVLSLQSASLDFDLCSCCFQTPHSLKTISSCWDKCSIWCFFTRGRRQLERWAARTGSLQTGPHHVRAPLPTTGTVSGYVMQAKNEAPATVMSQNTLQTNTPWVVRAQEYVFPHSFCSHCRRPQRRLSGLAAYLKVFLQFLNCSSGSLSCPLLYLNHTKVT